MDLDKLLEELDEDLAWRKKEISELLSVCKESDIEVLRKSLLLILYSHWEGFLKNAAKLYLLHVSKQKLKVGSLTLNFKTISMKGLINNCFKSSDTQTLDNELTFIEKFSKKDDSKFSIEAQVFKEKDKSLINTRDNLSPDVFNNICKILGLGEMKSLSTKKNYLDESFLGNRNKISHGSKIEIVASDAEDEFDLSLEAIIKLKDIIIAVMDRFKTDIGEYAIEKLYLLKHDDKKLKFDEVSTIELENVLYPKTR